MYHKLSIEETVAAFDVNTETGLSDKEVRLRVNQSAKTADSASFLKLVAGAFSHPAIYLLLASAAFSAFFGGIVESLLIALVVVSDIAFVAEMRRRRENMLRASVSKSVTHAIVLRNGAKMKVPSDELVVGDVVTIKPGRIVPADLRLITSENLSVDESMLTGKSVVEKDCYAKIPGDVPLAERANCAFEGTVVLHGRADGVVIATGMSTEMSMITLPQETDKGEESKTLAFVSELSRKLSLASALICVVIFAVGVIRNCSLIEMIMLSFALSAICIPESAFAAVGAALSKSAYSLKASGFLPKTSKAVETLGAVTVLCTEIPKLGVAATYTSGRIKTPQEEDTVPFIDGLLLCSLKNSSLAAFASQKCDAEKVFERFPKIGELSGEVTTTLHRAGNTTLSYTGGAVEDILDRSELVWSFGKIASMSEFEREEIIDAARAMREDGYSLTALGMRSGDDVPCDTGLIFLGIAATRAENSEATTPNTEELRREGVRVCLLTSENAEKARIGAAALSLDAESILSGREISAMKDGELKKYVMNTQVFSGLSPQHKVRIINALRSRGETVAVIGEEISDAPALDAANVGLSYAHSQDAAKGVSDVIYDGASSAAGAILRGKSAKINLKKALTYLLAANISEVICIFLSILLNFGISLDPLKILLLNLITDIIPVFVLASSDKKADDKPLYYVFIIAGVLGIAATALYKILLTAFEATAFEAPSPASWITFAFIAIGEIALVLPVYFSGRKK